MRGAQKRIGNRDGCCRYTSFVQIVLSELPFVRLTIIILVSLAVLTSVETLNFKFGGYENEA